MTLTAIIALILAYLMGSIPSAVWIGKTLYGVDVREFGSGNAGATNTFRVLGKKAGLLVLTMDILKGWLAVVMAAFISEAPPQTSQFVDLQIVLGVAAVIGHIFPVFAGFRGGKGIATLFGVILAAHPLACLISLGVFLLVFLAFRYVSLGSITAAIAFPVAVITVFADRVVPSMVIFSIMVAILVMITHQKNIERLIRREESKMKLVTRRKQAEEESPSVS
jgi:acyl phosphate:glycerol-3-phosphate acyltransferase